MYFVYVLQSQKDQRYYVGYTRDLESRLNQHNAGKTKSLKHRLPLSLVYYETVADRQEAYARERQIKSYKGGAAFRQLIEKFVGSPPPEAGSRFP